MNKMFRTGLAVVLAAGSLATLSAPAQARDWNGGYGGGYDRGYHHDGDGAGAAIAGGVIGLVLGAAIASSSHHNDYAYRSEDYGYRSNGYGYGTNYYGSGYGEALRYDGNGDRADYGYGQRQCVVRRQVWDGYDGRYEVRRVTVPC